MSRSYKKRPVIKDKGRKDYNKIFRRKERQRLKEGKQLPIKTRELVNDWDVCDWKFHGEEHMPWLSEKEKEEFKKRIKRK